MAKIPTDILKMALDAIDEPVATVGRAMSDMPETAARALDDMAGAVDDWGWKGGKPREITGRAYDNALYDYSETVKRNATKGLWPPDVPDTIVEAERYWGDKALEGKLGSGWQEYAKDYYKPDADGNWITTNWATTPQVYGTSGNIGKSFANLERADIPREWTGKVFRAFPGSFITSDMATSLSKALRDMYVKGEPDLTRQYRETFLSLLPEWEGSIEDLAVVARSLV